MTIFQNITLVDSPGVTEYDAETFGSKDYTERCQENVACGYIYMLDGSRSAEEAVQVRLNSRSNLYQIYCKCEICILCAI